MLSNETLEILPAEVAQPSYDREATRIGIVHFGPGAFHRAHQAWFIERLREHDPRWGICGVSLRSSEIRTALEPQDGLYTLATLDEKIAYQVIGVLREILVAPRNPDGVLERLSAPDTHVVTITVTEKGYCLDAQGNLDATHPDIQHDLASPHTPLSLIGFLVEGLRLRLAHKLPPLTIISCDNLVDNGTRLACAVKQFAVRTDAALANWIEQHVRFPRTMVDSITPATTPELRKRVAVALGLEDRWPVQREGFVQWVLEDKLGPNNPDWASVGVILTDDVSAYDRAKLRLLNGAHSTLAYLGLLGGHETVAQAMADEELSGFVAVLMRQDILPTLTAPRGMSLTDYIEAILKRFRNPSIRHALAQIAWDGSQKLPFRVLGTIVDNLAAGRSIERLCRPIAAWMQFVRRKASSGERVIDPLADRLLAIGAKCQNDAAADVPLFMVLESVFPENLASDERFRTEVARAYEALGKHA